MGSAETERSACMKGSKSSGAEVGFKNGDCGCGEREGDIGEP
jgi:hypothetical protein